MAMSKGCTVALIILAAIVLLLIITGIILYTQRDKVGAFLLDTVINKASAEIIANLPDGYTEADVRMLMADLKTAVKNNEISGAEISELANAFKDAIGDEEITKDEGARLLEMIENALGRESPSTESSPVDSLSDSLQMAPDSI
jgi:hypothetical protein